MGVLGKMKQRFCERPGKILIYLSRFWQKRCDVKKSFIYFPPQMVPEAVLVLRCRSAV